MRVIADDKMLRQFVRRATKAYPREWGEILYGTIGRDEIVVKEMVQVAHLSSPNHFWYDRSKIPDELPSGRLLGSIHSHPDAPDLESVAIPSVEDWSLVFRDEEMIHGICHIKIPGRRPRTTIQFFLGYPALLELKRK